MSTPQTEAGKKLLDAIQSGVVALFANDDGPDDPSPVPSAIAQVEAEAVSLALTRLADQVIELWPKHSGESRPPVYYPDGYEEATHAVLDLIEKMR